MLFSGYYRVLWPQRTRNVEKASLFKIKMNNTLHVVKFDSFKINSSGVWSSRPLEQQKKEPLEQSKTISHG